jgi:heme-degrading monooxygenase HmoA
VYARATTLRVSPKHVQEGIAHYQAGIPTFREIAGNRGAFLLVDRSSGKGIGVTLWESEEAMRASRQRADELRQQAAQESSGEIASVDEYEVAVWAVS